jgi:hypothetical protein
MEFKLLARREPKWETIEIGGESFEILCGFPSFQDKVIDDELRYAELVDGDGKRTEARLKAIVKDWRGVTAETGANIEFTWEAFEGVCAANHYVFRQALGLVVSRFGDTSAEEKKPDKKKPKTKPSEH